MRRYGGQRKKANQTKKCSKYQPQDVLMSAQAFKLRKQAEQAPADEWVCLLLHCPGRSYCLRPTLGQRLGGWRKVKKASLCASLPSTEPDESLLSVSAGIPLLFYLEIAFSPFSSVHKSHHPSNNQLMVHLLLEFFLYITPKIKQCLPLLSNYNSQSLFLSVCCLLCSLYSG